MLILVFSATGSATSGRSRRKFKLAFTCDGVPFASGAKGYRFNSCRAY
jgi:hypothetical protein